MKKDFAFDRMNYLLIAVGVVIVIIGFVLMSGSGSNETEFNPEIFNAMRIKVAPIVCVIGFIAMVFGIMHKPKDKEELS